MAPLLVEVVVAGIDIGSPRLAVFTGDDVDDTGYGIGTIERRSCTLYYLDTSYISIRSGKLCWYCYRERCREELHCNLAGYFEGQDSDRQLFYSVWQDAYADDC